MSRPLEREKQTIGRGQQTKVSAEDSVEPTKAADAVRSTRGRRRTTASKRAMPPMLSGEVKVKTLVKPVSKAFSILRYMASEGQPVTNSQIARHLGINGSTCFNIMRTLAYEGMIEFDAQSKAYRIGLELGKLASNAIQQGERLTAARPHLHAFAEKFSVTLALWRRTGEDRMVLAIAEHSSTALSIAMREGRRLPVLLGATGRVVATRLGLTKAEVHNQFKTLRWARPLSFETFWSEAKHAAEVGWGTDRGNFAAGIQTVAAPVYDPSGRVALSLVAFMFLGQFDESTVERIGTELIALATELTRIIY
jgi:DNA-binding IclR family transcriptional regulator